jgi:hypothetical protein
LDDGGYREWNGTLPSNEWYYNRGWYWVTSTENKTNGKNNLRIYINNVHVTNGSNFYGNNETTAFSVRSHRNAI